MRFHSSLDGILVNRTALRVARLLVGNVGSEFTGREVAIRSKTSPANAIRELRRFEDNGLVERRVVGRAQVWKWKGAHYLTKPLRAAFLAEEGTLKALCTEIVRELGPDERVIKAVLFGSVARGDERAGSDIDLLVIARDERSVEAVRQRLDRLLERVSRSFGNSLAPIVYSAEEARRKNRPTLLVNVEREGVVLLDRTK